MNKENVKKLREFIKRMPNKAFSMPNWLHKDVKSEAHGNFCGTTCCLGGACCIMELGFKATIDDLTYFNSANFLGLTEGQRTALFFPVSSGYSGYDWGSRTDEERANAPTINLEGAKGKAAAIKQLNYMLKHGKVNEYV